MQSEPQPPSPKPPRKQSLLTIVGSTIAAAFGVQSSKNRERDFQQGSIWVYIVSGIVFTLLFILTVTTVVRFALGLANRWHSGIKKAANGRFFLGNPVLSARGQPRPAIHLYR